MEEKQLTCDIRDFDMESAGLTHVDGKNRRGKQGLLRLVVPGLAEGRPSVLHGDSVLVKEGRRVHVGYAHTVERDAVILSLSPRFVSRYAPF